MLGWKGVGWVGVGVCVKAGVHIRQMASDVWHLHSFSKYKPQLFCVSPDIRTTKAEEPFLPLQKKSEPWLKEEDRKILIIHVYPQAPNTATRVTFLHLSLLQKQVFHISVSYGMAETCIMMSLSGFDVDESHAEATPLVNSWDATVQYESIHREM